MLVKHRNFKEIWEIRERKNSNRRLSLKKKLERAVFQGNYLLNKKVRSSANVGNGTNFHLVSTTLRLKSQPKNNSLTWHIYPAVWKVNFT